MIGIIGAMPVEIKELEKLIENKKVKNISSIKYISGSLNSKEVVLAECGVGKVNSAVCSQTMILEYSPDFIVNTGVAGGLNEFMRIGDVAIATNVLQHDIDTTAVGDPKGFISKLNIVEIPCEKKIVDILFSLKNKFTDVNFYKGTIVTGDQFITNKNELLDIKESFNAIACEMEGASIGQVCYMNKTPFAVIRSISDYVDNKSIVDYPKFVEEAAKRSSEVVQNLISAII